MPREPWLNRRRWPAIESRAPRATDYVKTLVRSLDPKTLESDRERRNGANPGGDGGPVLARWLSQGRPDPFALLERCGASWRESFTAGSPYLPGLTIAIAESPLLAQVATIPKPGSLVSTN